MITFNFEAILLLTFCAFVILATIFSLLKLLNHIKGMEESYTQKDENMYDGLEVISVVETPNSEEAGDVNRFLSFEWELIDSQMFENKTIFILGKPNSK